jgi:hypothetical protein
MDSDEKAPKKRDASIGTKVPREIADAARKRAREEGRSLSEVLRSFLFFWANEETPPGFPPQLPGSNERAGKGGRPEGSKDKKPRKRRKKKKRE